LIEWPSGSAESLLAGNNLADGFFCVPWLLKGDLDYFAKHLGLKHYARDDFCDFCKACKTKTKGMWPHNCLPSAEWKTTILSAQQWRDENDNKHWIFQRFPFLSQMNVTPDELHVYHLGVSQWMLGSVLWFLSYRILPGDPEANLEQAWYKVVE
jgi:hypothetical protein